MDSTANAGLPGITGGVVRAQGSAVLPGDGGVRRPPRERSRHPAVPGRIGARGLVEQRPDAGPTRSDDGSSLARQPGARASASAVAVAGRQTNGLGGLLDRRPDERTRRSKRRPGRRRARRDLFSSGSSEKMSNDRWETQHEDPANVDARMAAAELDHRSPGAARL